MLYVKQKYGVIAVRKLQNTLKHWIPAQGRNDGGGEARMSLKGGPE